MTPKEELAHLDAEEKRLEARRRAIYKASVTAPENEKVCADYVAEMLGTESPFRTLEYPVEVRGIHYQHEINQDTKNSGRLVIVRPASEKETYLGVYLGRLPLSLGASYNPTSGVMSFSLGMHNPTMWIPKLSRIVHGCGSWWRYVKSEADFKEITDQDINNTWYVKAWKERQQPKTDVPPPDPSLSS